MQHDPLEEPKGAALGAEWPLLLADGSYGTAGGVAATAHLCLDQRGRAASTRVLYRAAPSPTGKAGHPREDGARFKGSDSATHGEPAAWTGGRAPTRAGGRSRCAVGAACTARSAAPSLSRRSASRAPRPPTPRATGARPGSGGLAARPRPRGQSPGRARGAVVLPAPRHPVIHKGPARRPTRPRAA